MALARDDRWLADAQGRALAGALVYWCLQPATAPAVPPPSPLATVYADLSATPADNPQITDGFGHAIGYLDDSPLYTLVFYHPLFGANPVVLRDQRIGGSGGTGSVVTPFAGVPLGAIDGANATFILRNGTTLLTSVPTQMQAWLNFSQIPDVGYSVGLSGGFATIVYSTPPQPASGGSPADSIYAQGLYIT